MVCQMKKGDFKWKVPFPKAHLFWAILGRLAQRFEVGRTIFHLIWKQKNVIQRNDLFTSL